MTDTGERLDNIHGRLGTLEQDVQKLRVLW